MSPRRAPLLALLALALLGSSSRPAAADDLYAYDEPAPDPGDDGVGRYYLGGGAALSGHSWLAVGGYVDGGVRVPRRHIWVRGKLATAVASDDQMVEATIGVEGRRCVVAGVLCGALGVDGGRLTGDVDTFVMALRASGDLAVTRTLALRLALETRRLTGGDEPEMEPAGLTGLGGSLGVVYRF
jgi:hypothetical protein